MWGSGSSGQGHWRSTTAAPSSSKAPTGALMSLVTSQQGESIPGICHALALEAEEGAK